MSVVVVVTLFVLSFSDPITKGTYYDCGQIKEKEECKNALWCYWQTSCWYDQVLKPVTRAEYDTADGDVAVLCPGSNGDGSVAKLYYITDLHDCNDNTCPTNNFADIYCREDNPAFARSEVLGDCFYADLEFRATNPTTGIPKVKGNQCIKNDTLHKSGDDANLGYYVYNKPLDNTIVSDCSLLTIANGLCSCLGNVSLDWCHLHPECTLNKAKSACITDPCTEAALPGTQKGAVCNPQVAGCTTSAQLWDVSLSTNTTSSKLLCVATGDHTAADINNNTNECFYAYKGSSKAGEKCPTYNECRTTAEYTKCESTKQNDDSGNQIDTVCTLETIPEGYFPVNKYCNDGRSVPSLSGDAASLVGVPLLFTTVLLALLFAL